MDERTNSSQHNQGSINPSELTEGLNLENESTPYPETLVYNELVRLYPLWRDALLHGDKLAQEKQVKFLKTILTEVGVNTVIDLGGGIGTHSIPLAKDGYKVTIFDASDEALSLVREKEKMVQTIHGQFETIALDEKFDASICMWSTINYLLRPSDRRHFANWITAHTNRLVVIDQPNILSYPATFSKEYEVADEQTKLKIVRNWRIKNQVRKTDYTYQITDKAGKSEIVKDNEIQYFMTLTETKDLMGKDWSTKYVLGEYDRDKAFDPAGSSRLITVFEKV